VNVGKLFFFIALSATCLKPWITSIPVLTFAPYLVYHLTQGSLKTLMVRAMFVGIVIDCFSSFLPFGFHMSAFVICCMLLYRKRALLIGDKPLSLPLYTFGFALLFTFCEHMYLGWSKTRLVFNTTTFISEFLIMPLLDSSYALLCFTLPAWLITKLKEIRLKA
jgi:hypothetical protein